MTDQEQQLECIAGDTPYWMHVNDIQVDGRSFDLVGRKYQQDIMRSTTPEGKFKHNEVIRKGSQIGVTICKVAEVTHGALHGLYPQGIIIYFPSKTAVELFSASRFKPFIEDNPEAIGKFMGKVDRADVRIIGKTNVYFFGGTATIRIGGSEKDSTAVRSTPADWILLDERDAFDEEMTKQVNQRLGNSQIWRRTDMGTPKIPEYGIDLLYKKSNQGRWQIQCESCKKHTCVESEFPSCIKFSDNGYYFKCSHCGGRIDTNEGGWEFDEPKRDIVGYWVSQLLNPNTNLDRFLKQYANPEDYDTTPGEFQRVSMGLPYIDTEDELQESDVFACCGRDGMAIGSKMGCAMGVDVGNPLYAVIGYPKDRGRYQVIKLARVPDWGALHDLAKKFNIKSEVIDAQPEFHRVREYQKAEKHAVYLCYYNETQRQFVVWLPDNIVKVNRTEIFDATHCMVKDPGVLTLPRRDIEEVKVFAHQMTRSVRALETDKRTGSKIYRYRRRGDKEDHYRNAMNYFLMACKKIGIPREIRADHPRPLTQDMSYQVGVQRDARRELSRIQDMSYSH